MTEENNYFQILSNINVSDKIEKKNNLSYLSWAWAWGKLKKIYPDAKYIVHENPDGWNYFHDNRTAWVKTTVIVNDIDCTEYLPVMDYKNKSIPLERLTSFDVNKAIQRSLTKAIARHGLGLYIYAGEDLPEKDDGNNEPITPYSGNKQGFSSSEIKKKYISIESRLRTCENLIELRKVWEAHQDDIKAIKEFDDQSGDSLEGVKNAKKAELEKPQDIIDDEIPY